MITAIFTILMLMVFGKLLVFAFKFSWGILKVLGYLVFLPIILIAFFASGLAYVAVIALFVVGVTTLIKAIIA